MNTIEFNCLSDDSCLCGVLNVSCDKIVSDNGSNQMAFRPYACGAYDLTNGSFLDGNSCCINDIRNVSICNAIHAASMLSCVQSLDDSSDTGIETVFHGFSYGI